MSVFVVAILGAESTGKTTLAQALATRLGGVFVAEFLREFCHREQRTPRRDEQAGIAAEQSRRIDAAAAPDTVVVADTTAVQIAVYSEMVFGDDSLHAQALADHARRVDLTLLTALDLPWMPDGHQRDGPHVREPVDALLRAALQRGGIAHAVVAGHGEARLEHAWRAVQRHRTPPRRDGPRWHWVCERCGEAGCERHLLAR